MTNPKSPSPGSRVVGEVSDFVKEVLAEASSSPASPKPCLCGSTDIELRCLECGATGPYPTPELLQVPKGYALVPVKPTKAMVRAAINIQGVWPDEAKAAWKAMVKAATSEGPNHG